MIYIQSYNKNQSNDKNTQMHLKIFRNLDKLLSFLAIKNKTFSEYVQQYRAPVHVNGSPLLLLLVQPAVAITQNRDLNDRVFKNGIIFVTPFCQ